jgi:hypothetical protein
MSNPDGQVLVENIFVSDEILAKSVADPTTWPGITPQTSLKGDYAKKLRTMSSVVPRGYRTMMLEKGYQIEDGAVMMLPGESPDLVEMGFVMSMSTPTSAQ